MCFTGNFVLFMSAQRRVLGTFQVPLLGRIRSGVFHRRVGRLLCRSGDQPYDRTATFLNGSDGWVA